MSPVAIGLLAFGLALAGITLGCFMQRRSGGQLNTDSKEVVKLSATTTALFGTQRLRPGAVLFSVHRCFVQVDGTRNESCGFLP